MKLSAEILELGRAIVEHLNVDDRNDLLARWMAHDIAEKISAAASPGATAQTKSDCAEAILNLWAHRASLPSGRRPYADLEPLINTLSRIDPAAPNPYYMQPKPQTPSEAETWLTAALDFDSTARVMILYALKAAAAASTGSAQEWAGLADAADLHDPESRLLRVIIVPAGSETPNDIELARRLIQKRLDDLKRFSRGAGMIAGELNAELAALDALEISADEA